MLHTYLARWRQLNRSARLYLAHAALLTASLGISSLIFNLAILSFGFSRGFLGWLQTLSVAVAAVLSLPLWWLVTRLGLRWGLLVNAVLQAISLFVYAVWPHATPLLLAVALTGMAAVVFQVSSPPFMMQHSDDHTRDHLFSANTAINIGFAGVSSLLAGGLPSVFGALLGVGAESPLAYQATFAVAGVVALLSIVPLLLIPRVRADVPAAAPQPATPSTAADSVGAAGWRGMLGRVPEPYRGWLRHPWPLLALLVPPFLISWGAALLIPYLNLFFKETYGIADSTLGVIFAVLGITTGLAASLGPLISARIGKIATIALAQALSIPFLLTLGFVPVLGIAFGAAVVRAALFNMCIPLYDAFAMERTAAAHRPVVIGLVNGAYTVGYLFAPRISAVVQERYGFAPLFVATACCYAAAALANYLFFVRRRALPAEQALV